MIKLTINGKAMQAPEGSTILEAARLADIYIGVQDVVLVVQEGEVKRPLRMPFRVEVSEELISKLKELVGDEGVKVK